jgi:hypothetical protein
MKTVRKVTPFVIVMIVVGVSFGCAEAKIGIGPFKAASVEVGPGGAEVKGPSAGPLKGTKAKSQLKKDN